MSMRRVDMDRLQELVRLHRMGTGAREVARVLGLRRQSLGPARGRVDRIAIEMDRVGDPPLDTSDRRSRPVPMGGSCRRPRSSSLC